MRKNLRWLGRLLALLLVALLAWLVFVRIHGARLLAAHLAALHSAGAALLKARGQ